MSRKEPPSGELVSLSLESMEFWADYWTQRRVILPETTWFAAGKGSVLAVVEAKLYTGRRRRQSGSILVSQCLGSDPASGEVTYGVRNLKSGPLIVWAAGVRALDEVTFVDTETNERQHSDGGTIVDMSMLVRNAATNLREIFDGESPPPTQTSNVFPERWMNTLNCVVMMTPEP
jgi:hypothetical protein